MKEGKKTLSRLTLVAGGLALAVLLAIFAASYLAGVALIAGVLLPLLIYMLLARWGGAASGSRLRLAAGAISLALVGAIALIVVARLSGPHLYPSYSTATVSAYNAVIRPSGSGLFTVTEDAAAELDGFDVVSPTQTLRTPRLHSTRTVAAVSKGWLLREVSFTPLANVEFTLANGSKIQPLFLPDFGVKLAAQVQDMPAGSLYAVKRAQGLAASTYLDSETTTWFVTDLQESITFAYLPSPWHHLKPVVAPFLTLSSLARWLVGILGLLGGTVVGAFVQPALLVLLRDRMASPMLRLLKRGKATPSATDKTS
jgi:hypothetical protein